MKKRFFAILLTAVLLFAFTVVPISASAETVVYRFGIKDDTRYEIDPEYNSAVFKTQGMNNYYAYYAKKYNVGAVVTASDLNECEYAVNKNSYGMKFMVPKADDVNNYINNVWPTLGESGNPQFWWRMDNKGICCPAGNMTAVIGFKAPATGKYSVNALFYGGCKPDTGNVADNADGVSFSVIAPTGTLFQQNTGRVYYNADSSIDTGTHELSLKKDEFVYFVVDPNGTYANDAGHWYINVTEVEVEQSGSSSSSSSSSGGDNGTSQSGTASVNNNNSSTNNNNNSSSQTSTDNKSSSAQTGTSSNQASADDGSATQISAEGNESTDGENTDNDIENSENIDSENQANENKTGKSYIWLIIVIAVVVLAVGGFALYWFVLTDKFLKKNNTDGNNMED